ncbi:MAG: PHB depolymerase family esterase [Smithellaceae bacterium]
MAMILVSLLLVGCMRSLPSGKAFSSGTYRQKMDMRYNLLKRSYQVHVPPSYDLRKPLPLVVVIHGAFDNASGVENATGFSELADRESFIVQYPNGISLFGFLQHWNAGHCCGKAAADKVDDVGFIAKAIEDLCSRLNVDRNRIYMVGFSNGGMMAYRFAAERSDLLAAVAPLAASIGGRASVNSPEWRIPLPSHQLPVISIHGMQDEDVPYDGGTSPRRGGDRSYWSVPDSIGFWVTQNGCREAEDEQELHQGAVILKSWTECNDDSEVSLYLLKEWGHVWPGSVFLGSLEKGHPLREFEAADIIWNFFKRHHR